MSAQPSNGAGHAKLNVNIIGAGIAGLATATALAREGHQVTVYEYKKELSEFGAGIQLFANGSRLLYSWGLGEKFRAVCNESEDLTLRRWQDGSELCLFPSNPNSVWTFGYPQWQIGRPDFQRLLYEAATAEGAIVKFGFAVQAVDTSKGVLTFRDGSTTSADLTIGADGIWSKSRTCLPATADVRPKPYREHVYRAAIPKEVMDADPVTAELMTGRLSMIWCGPEFVVLGYPMGAGQLYNFVGSCTRPDAGAEVSDWTKPGDPDVLRRLLKDWCPEVVKLTEKITECAVWTLAEVPKVESYISETGKFALVGDAAHAILPHAGQGGSMALEDAAALAEFVSCLQDLSQLPSAMQKWFEFRQDRVERVRRLASGNADMFSYPDGPMQEVRDRKWAAIKEAWLSQLRELGEDGVKEKAERERPEMDKNAENFSSPGARMYLHGYDAVAEAKKCAREGS